jgi:broad specificity phosphatase PhoE
MYEWFKRPNLYLARHGNTDRNDANPPEYRGWDDVELNDDGLKAGEEIAQYLSYERLGQIASSDLRRAIVTAEMMLPMSSIPYLDPNPNLRPLDVGDFAGKPKTERNKKALQHYIDNPDEPIPGSSETVNQFQRRSNEALKGYLLLSMQYSSPCVVVCHTSNIAALYEETTNDKYAPEEADIVGPGGLIAVYLSDNGNIELKPLLKVDESHEGTPTAS